MDFATNWIRAFRNINRDIKWLNAFGVINELACKKILNQFMKDCFVLSDNVLDKSFLRLIETSEFARRRNMDKIQNDLIEIVGDFFAESDKKKGEQILNEDDSKLMRRQDMCMISFFGGASIVLCLL